MLTKYHWQSTHWHWHGRASDSLTLVLPLATSAPAFLCRCRCFFQMSHWSPQISGAWKIAASKLYYPDGSGRTLGGTSRSDDDSCMSSPKTLGAGCFGSVATFVYLGAPVAVKELKPGSLDAGSLGTVLLCCGWCVAGVWLVCCWCVAGVWLVMKCPNTIRPNSREHRDHRERSQDVPDSSTLTERVDVLWNLR